MQSFFFCNNNYLINISGFYRLKLGGILIDKKEDYEKITKGDLYPG